MIKAIIFDCFGVLYRGSLGYLYEIVPESKWQELRDASRAADYGFMSLDEYIETVSELSGYASQDIKAVTKTHHVKNDQLVDYIRTLKPNYKIGLLSNIGRGVFDSLFSASQQAELFDTVVLSSDVGMAKPSTAIYELTAHQLGVPPKSCIMIDDMQSNIDGAQVVGMKGVVYTSNKQLKSDLEKYGVHSA